VKGHATGSRYVTAGRDCPHNAPSFNSRRRIGRPGRVTRVLMEMFNPPHPGEIIRDDCLKPLDLSATAAAKWLGVSRVLPAGTTVHSVRRTYRSRARSPREIDRGADAEPRRALRSPARRVPGCILPWVGAHRDRHTIGPAMQPWSFSLWDRLSASQMPQKTMSNSTRKASRFIDIRCR
jgi:hypothetical protein